MAYFRIVRIDTGETVGEGEGTGNATNDARSELQIRARGAVGREAER